MSIQILITQVSYNYSLFNQNENMLFVYFMIVRLFFIWDNNFAILLFSTFSNLSLLPTNVNQQKLNHN